MNGTSSSLHIKGSTPKQVQQAVTELLASEGFQVSKATASDVENADKVITRGLWIAKTKGDWVSLFCSDFLFQQEIGRELSKRLATHAVNIWTNDESAWHYTLFHNGEEVDQFDSISGEFEGGELFAGGDDDKEFGESDDELELDAADEEFENGQLQEGLDRISQLQERLSHQMPEDVRSIVDRLNEGRATLGEMRRFDQWSQAHQAELQQFQDQLQEQTAELSASIQSMFQQEFVGEEGEAKEMLNQVLPPDMAEAFGKILSGEASYEDLARLADMTQMDPLAEDDPLLQADEDDVPETTFGESASEWEGDDEDEFADDERSALSEEQLQIHLGALRPLLSKDTDPDEVVDTLTNQDELPEQPLGEFLELLGIDETLSDLDFDAIDELGGEEMAERGVDLGPLLLVRTNSK